MNSTYQSCAIINFKSDNITLSLLPAHREGKIDRWWDGEREGGNKSWEGGS